MNKLSAGAAAVRAVCAINPRPKADGVMLTSVNHPNLDALTEQDLQEVLYEMRSTGATARRATCALCR